jgi:hypothetical protein
MEWGGQERIPTPPCFASTVDCGLRTEGVSYVGSPAPNWALTGHDGLDRETQHGEHGQTSFLDLLKLGETVKIVGQTQGVEGATRQQTGIFTGTASLVGTVGISGTLQ